MITIFHGKLRSSRRHTVRHFANRFKWPFVVLVFFAVDGMAIGQQPASRPTFRSGTDLVRVDVVVRDRNGDVVRGLKADDFVIQEDGKAQQVTSFDFEEIATEAAAAAAPVPSVLGLQQLQTAAAASVLPAAAAAPQDLSGRRMIVLLFDISAMQPEEVDRAVKSANNYVDKQMAPADAIAVASVGQSLTILRDFSSDRDVLKATLGALDATAGTGFEQPVAADVTDVAADADPADLPLDDSEFGIFNNDRRLRAMRVLCEALAPIEQKKALMYFSGGMSRSGSDNEVELRAVTNTCNRANTSIYTVDSRGLAAVVPGGAAGGGGGRGGGGGGRGGGGGSSVFSGRSMLSQFASLNASQETLTTLAADTGGQSFLDTNDFAPAFTRMQRDMSAYYLLGYRTTNASKDGKFRKISVKLKSTAAGYRVEARAGYYAAADFAHLDKNNRERQLQEQIASPVSATDVPVVAAISWFRVTNDRFYVPVSIAVPGSAVPPRPASGVNASIDLLGVVSDEQGRSVGRIRDAIQIPANQAADIATKQLQYQSGLTLPAGHFKVKVAVRENLNGAMGTFEFPITIPDLKAEPLKISPVVLSTQLRFARGGGPGGRGRPGGPGAPGGRGGRGGDVGRGGGDFGGPPINSMRGGGGPMFGDQSPNPLLRNGQEIVQSLSHLVLKAQQMYFYFEVYDPPTTLGAGPSTAPGSHPMLKASLAFYRGRVKVFETPIIEKSAIDDAERHAVIFQLALPAATFKPGLYTCQVNIIDEVSGRFAFPRLALYVK